MTVTKRTSTQVWSYPNIHGDVAAVVDQNGAKQGSTYTYDPYGNSLSGQLVDNLDGKLDAAWIGARLTEHETGLASIQEMGARQYDPRLGRFLEVDPVSGGSCNDYDYVCADPVNGRDLAGTNQWTLCNCIADALFLGAYFDWLLADGGREAVTQAIHAIIPAKHSWMTDVGQWINKYKWNIAGAVVTGVCVTATFGTCAVAAGTLLFAKTAARIGSGTFTAKRFGVDILSTAVNLLPGATVQAAKEFGVVERGVEIWIGAGSSPASVACSLNDSCSAP